ncbi:MAG: hypothetical protein ACFCVK_00635 [Acidimicrobiales bacterium]
MRSSNLSLIVAITVLSFTALSLTSELDVRPAGGAEAGGRAVATAPTATTAPAATTGPAQAPAAHPPVELDDLTDAEVRGFAALAGIEFPWRDRLPDWEIRFHEATDGAYGYTLTQERRIDIYVRPGQSDELLAHVIAHELGHALDVTLNDGDDRQRWQAARGIADAPWWPDNRAADFATGAGDFAESFAAWQVGALSFRSELGSPPTSDHERLLAELTLG